MSENAQVVGTSGETQSDDASADGTGGATVTPAAWWLPLND